MVTLYDSDAHNRDARGSHCQQAPARSGMRIQRGLGSAAGGRAVPRLQDRCREMCSLAVSHTAHARQGFWGDPLIQIFEGASL